MSWTLFRLCSCLLCGSGRYEQIFDFQNKATLNVKIDLVNNRFQIVLDKSGVIFFHVSMSVGLYVSWSLIDTYNFYIALNVINSIFNFFYLPHSETWKSIFGKETVVTNRPKLQNKMMINDN